jgi:hypothetical protein
MVLTTRHRIRDREFRGRVSGDQHQRTDYVGSCGELVGANRRRQLEVIKKRWALLHGF